MKQAMRASLVVLALTLIPLAAQADPMLTAATTSASCNSNSGTVSGPTSCSDSGESVTISTSPLVLMAGVNDIAGDGNHLATAMVTFWFEVIGGNPGDSVLLGLTLDLTTSSDPHSGAIDEVYTDVNQNEVEVCSGDEGPCAYGTSFAGTEYFDSPSGYEREITLNVEAEEGGVYGGDPSASSDFCIAPVTAGIYSVVVSSGIGNCLGAAPVSQAPEPATFALFGAGLLGLGFLYRLRTVKRSL